MSHRSVPEAGPHARALRLAITTLHIAALPVAALASRAPVAPTMAAAGTNDRGACAR